MDGAGAIPIAMPLCWWVKISPNFMRLLCITIWRASIRAVVDMCGNCSFVDGVVR